MNIIVFAVSFPFIAAFIIWILFKKRHSESDRSVLAVTMIVVSIMELAAVISPLVHDLTGTIRGSIRIGGIGGLGLCFAYTGLRGIFSVLTAAAWFVVSIYSKEFMKNDTRVIRYNFFYLVTFGATMGIFYAADFFTFFFFFEMMSFTSFVWVAHRKNCASQYAAGTYLGIAIAGGMAILMGLFIVYDRLGTLNFQKIHASVVDYYFLDGGNPLWIYAAAGCMFVGFGAKAGAFPVHVWLPAAYTEAPAPATALLSAILSKTGVIGILLVTVELMAFQESWGMFLLIIGLITMALGGIKGVLSSNLKTTLAYSSMSQIGFMLVGMGMAGLFSGLLLECPTAENVMEVSGAYYMAVDGTLLHMLNHALIKLVLFLTAGIVYQRAGGYELNRVRGYGYGKPFLLVTFLIAAAGVGGIPLFNGYVSKTLLHESIVEYTVLAGSDVFRIVEYLFLFSGGLTVAYMIKLFVVLFVEENEDIGLQEQYDADENYASLWSKLVIGFCALAALLLGVLPNMTADAIVKYGQDLTHLTLSRQDVRAEAMNYFSLRNLSGALISIAVGAVVYILVVRLVMLRKKAKGYRELFPIWLNMEKYVYRAVFYKFFPFLLGIISRILDSVVDMIVIFLRKTVYRDRPIPYELPEGNCVTHTLGRSMEAVQKIYCEVKKKDYEPKNYEHKLALKNTDIFENLHIIERSLSFGLFMFCVGLGLTMIYLLVVN